MKKCRECLEDKEEGQFYESRAVCKMCLKKITSEKLMQVKEDSRSRRCVVCGYFKTSFKNKSLCTDCFQERGKVTRARLKGSNERFVSLSEQEFVMKACKDCFEVCFYTDFIGLVCRSCHNQKCYDQRKKKVTSYDYIWKCCSECGDNPFLSEFVGSKCKTCYSTHRRNVVLERVNDKTERLCSKCGELKTDYRFEATICLDCEKDRVKKYMSENPKKKPSEDPKVKASLKKAHAKWYNKNKIVVSLKQKEYRNNSLVKECTNHGTALNRFYKGSLKSSKYLPFQCERGLFLEWLEFQFSDTMSHDTYPLTWNMDHVIPKAYYLNSQHAREIVFHWLNIQPLLAINNFEKNKYTTTTLFEEHKNKIKNFIFEKRLLMTYDIRNYIDGLELILRDTLQREPPKASDTTSVEKSTEGSRLIAEPDGNNSEDLE